MPCFQQTVHWKSHKAIELKLMFDPMTCIVVKTFISKTDKSDSDFEAEISLNKAETKLEAWKFVGWQLKPPWRL